MKTKLFTMLLVIFTFQLYSQNHKFTIGFEYSPNFSSTTNHYDAEGFYFAQHIFLNAGYEISQHLTLTTGFGFLTYKEHERFDFDIQPDLTSLEFYRKHNHILMPFGIKYSFGSFFVRPEIGIGYNIGDPTRSIIYQGNGDIVESYWNDNINTNDYHKITTPLFLTIGNEIHLKPVTIMLGIKGYYSINNISKPGYIPRHYMGFGIVTGVRF